MVSTFSFYGKQVVIRTSRLDWSDPDIILNSKLFETVLNKYLEKLRGVDSDYLKLFPKPGRQEQEMLALRLIKVLSKMPREEAAKKHPDLKTFFSDIYEVDQFVENFYNYWRSFERYLVCTSEPENGEEGRDIDKKPYRTFNNTIETLNHQVRGIYRNIRENITHEHPIIFRQIPAGCQVGVIATEKETSIPKNYSELKKIPVIRQVLIEPPLIIDPPNNTRKGEFKLVESNPLEGIGFEGDEWLCFPAKVGDLVIYLYFHEFYTGLGIATSNLFEICNDKELLKKPDGIYAYGVPPEALGKFSPDKTVFYNDKKNGVMVAAIPRADEFGYFGYVKKMMLTLHNSIMIERGRMPVHGAMTRITLKGGEAANVIVFGDTGTGKSESLEAFRVLSEGNLKDMKVIFDDMGSLEVDRNGKVIAYGTETGAFVRLDDLQAGYAFGNIDRSIIMSPHKVNARAVIPITTTRDALAGWGVDYFLYANNYTKVENGSYIEKFGFPKEAMNVFKEGKRMAKGTTNEKGLVTAYYANIFGPSQFRNEHDKIAEKYFKAMFESGVYVGQIKTQLGIAGMEHDGPKLAAKALFEMIKNKKKK
jgi:hypothetical protein